MNQPGRLSIATLTFALALICARAADDPFAENIRKTGPLLPALYVLAVVLAIRVGLWLAYRPIAPPDDAALPSLTGSVSQVPPAYSAKRIDGRRAYDMARAGETVDLKAVTIRVDAHSSYVMRLSRSPSARLTSALIAWCGVQPRSRTTTAPRG